MSYTQQLQSTCSLLLLAFAPIAQAQELAILCAGGDPGDEMAAGIIATQHFVRIDIFDTTTSSPSMAMLSTFHTSSATCATTASM